MLTEKDLSTGEYKIPKIIYSDAYSSEMVAYADLILPDTTYLERHDAISMLDRPIMKLTRLRTLFVGQFLSQTGTFGVFSRCC